MNVFVIGASGYIGRALTAKLLEKGHRVIALARSDESAARLPVGDVETIRGEVANLDSLRHGLERADAVIYLAIAGGSGTLPEDTAALNLIFDRLAGTDRPFIMTTGMGIYTGIQATEFDEETPLDAVSPVMAWRVQLERTVLDAASRGIRSIVIRPSVVYGRGGGSPVLRGALDYARKSGSAVYIAVGDNSVPVVYVDDLPAAYVLALEKAPAGMLFNVFGSSVSGKDMARGISYAAGLNGKIVSLTLPDTLTVLGPIGYGLATDVPASGLRTALVLGWTPGGPSLLHEFIYGSNSQVVT